MTTKTKSKTPGRQTPTADETIAAKARNDSARLTAQRFAVTGRTTRVQGHVSAHNKRTQGRKDAR